MLEFTARSMENAAAAASNGVPSLNRTPGRSVKVQVVGAVWLQDVASSGVSSPEVGSRSMSGSVMLERTTTPVPVSDASQGSRVGGSSGRTIRTVSAGATPGPEQAVATRHRTATSPAATATFVPMSDALRSAHTIVGPPGETAAVHICGRAIGYVDVR